MIGKEIEMKYPPPLNLDPPLMGWHSSELLGATPTCESAWIFVTINQGQKIAKIGLTNINWKKWLNSNHSQGH